MEVFNTIPSLVNPVSTKVVSTDCLYTACMADRRVAVGLALEGDDTSHLGPRLLVSPSGQAQCVGLEELPGCRDAAALKSLIRTTLRQTVPWDTAPVMCTPKHPWTITHVSPDDFRKGTTSHPQLRGDPRLYYTLRVLTRGNLDYSVYPRQELPFSTPPVVRTPCSLPTLLLPITPDMDTRPSAYMAHRTPASPWVAVGTPTQLLRFAHHLPDLPMQVLKAPHGLALAWPMDLPLGPVQTAVSFLTNRRPSVT